MKKTLLLLVFIGVAFMAVAQPTVLGTQIVNGTYATYNLATVGLIKQVRLQATSSANTGSRTWEFATGSAGSANYSTNWRPYTSSNTLSANTFIPASFGNGAKYNTNSGGASGLLPAITSNNYYTFNVSNNNASDNVMALWETNFSPVTINTANTSATCDNMAVTVSFSTSAAPATGEYVYVRYSTDNFTTSNISLATFSSASGSAIIPAHSATTVVKYYLFSSSRNASELATIVTDNGQVGYDIATLNLQNNGSSYSYTVNARPAITVAKINDPCQLNSGSVTINITGGSLNYTISGSGITVSPSPTIGAAVTVSGIPATINTNSKTFSTLKGNVNYSF